MATEERRYDQHAAFAQALDHLCDALEIVDWRSGEIRNPATAQWYLEETLTRMATIDHYRVQKWSKTLRNHQHQLLTALDWLNSALEPLRTDLRQHCPTAELTLHFERTVARTWRLQQALINGHQRFPIPGTTGSRCTGHLDLSNAGPRTTSAADHPLLGCRLSHLQPHRVSQRLA